MKKLFLASLALTALLASCNSTDDDYSGYTNSTNESSETSTVETNTTSSTSGSTNVDTSGSLTNLLNMSIALDKSFLAETEDIPTSEDADFYNDYVEHTTFADTVYVSFDDSKGATVTPSDIATVSGNDVVINSTTSDFLVYHVSGSTSDGFLKIYSDKKYELLFDNVDITNPNGAAINIQSKKRCFVVLKGESTLTDGTSYSDATDDEDMKGTFFSEGQLCFSDYGDNDGVLNISSNCKNGLVSDDYLFFRKGIIVNVESSTNHSLKSNDGIYIMGGVINASTSATAGKALKTDGHIIINGGRTTAITTGASEYDSDDQDMTSAAAVKCDSTFTMNDGELYLKSTGAGGKGLNSDMTITINGGTIGVITTGARAYYNSNQNVHTSPKGIKSDVDIVINGGEVMVRTDGSGDGPECIESGTDFTVNGGTVACYSKSEDAINASTSKTSKISINGGYVFAMSSGNDGIDSNGTLSITGGVVIGIGTTTPEEGFDCDDNSFVISGGTLIGIGGTTSTPTSVAQPTAILGMSWTKGSYITVNNSSGQNILAFQVPSIIGFNNGTVLISSANMSAGTYTVNYGASVSSTTNEFYGLQTGATVSSSGTQAASLTFNSAASIVTSGVTATGNNGGGMPGGGQGGNMGPGGQGGGPGGR